MKKIAIFIVALCLSLSVTTSAVEVILVSEEGAGTVAVAPDYDASYGASGTPYAVPKHDAWTTIAGATWIASRSGFTTNNSETNGDCGSLRKFTREFMLPACADNITASIEIAGDNAYDIELNGAPVGSTVAPFMYGCPLYWDPYPGDPHWTGPFPYQATTTYPLSPDPGTNTLEIVVRNWPLEGGSGSEGTENPTGLIYKVVVNYDLPAPDLAKAITGDNTDVAVEVGKPTATVYCFTISYSNPGGPDVLILDTVPAEWTVTSATPEAGEPGEVEYGLAGKGNNAKSATKIEWRPDPALGCDSLEVCVVSRERGGSRKFSPTSCGLLCLNDGAEAYEVDPVTGEPLVHPVTGERLPPIMESDPLCLAAVKDLNGGGVVGNGSGDEDGDNLTDFEEVMVYGTDPCNPDTDGDGVNDDVDSDPLDSGVQ